MKRNRFRIKAFTILELAITMLISAIVIGITYTAYSIMSNSYLDFTRKNQSMGELIRVDELLKKDFEKSESITVDHQTLVFQDTTGTVKYRMEPDFIIRTSMTADTFKIKTTVMITAFEHQVINEENSEAAIAPLVDELSLNLLFKTDTIGYHYHKVYSSQNLVKRNPYALN